MLLNNLLSEKGIDSVQELYLSEISTNPTQPTRFDVEGHKARNNSGWLYYHDNEDTYVVVANHYYRTGEPNVTCVIPKENRGPARLSPQKTEATRIDEADPLKSAPVTAPAFRYLIKRGLKESVIRQLGKDVRYLDSVSYWRFNKESQKPEKVLVCSAIASKMKEISSGECQGYHRIYMDSKGDKPSLLLENNLPTKKVKLSNQENPLNNSAILLFDYQGDSRKVGVVEGVESGIALRQLGFSGRIYSLYSTSGFDLTLPPGNEIYIVYEGDASSRKSIDEFVVRNSDSDVFIYSFGEKTDPNDFIQQGGKTLPDPVEYAVYVGGEKAQTKGSEPQEAATADADEAPQSNGVVVAPKKFTPSAEDAELSLVLTEEDEGPKLIPLEDLIVPIGRVEGNRLALYSGYSKELQVFSQQDLTQRALKMMFGAHNLRRLFPLETRSGIDIDFNGVEDYIIHECTLKQFFDPTRIRGQGLWRDKKDLIFNGKKCLKIKSDGSLTEIRRVGNNYIYNAGSSFEIGDELQSEELIEIFETFKSFSFKNSSDVYYVFAWLVQAVLSGALHWRTHCYLNAEKGSGKSTLLNFVSKLLHGFCVSASGESVSAAGLRQKLSSSALPVLLDEAEGGARNLKPILELARNSSTGSSSLKGTQSQKALEFEMRSPFFMASIGAPALNPADQSRFIMIELNKRSSGNREVKRLLDKANEAELEELGSKFVGYIVRRAGSILPMISRVKQILLQNELIEERNADTISSLLGCYLGALRPGSTDAEISGFLDEAEISNHVNNEESDNLTDSEIVLEKILFSKVRAGMETVAVAELVFEAESKEEPRRELQRNGMTIQQEGATTYLCVMRNSDTLNDIFKDSQYGNGAYYDSLKRLKNMDGSQVTTKKVKYRALGKSLWSVRIPFEMIFVPESDLPPQATGFRPPQGLLS